MPSRSVPVRSHYRDTENKRVHVRDHTREVDSGVPLQYNLEEVLGPQHNLMGTSSEDEPCSVCGRYRHVHQRTVAGQPVCRPCHEYQLEDHRNRQLEVAKNEQDWMKREKEWEHRRSYR